MKRKSQVAYSRKSHGPGDRYLDGASALAADLIHQALDHMRGPQRTSWKHIMQQGIERDATLWLASQAAAPWFDLADVDQRAALEAIDWPRYGRALLKSHELAREERIFIRRVCAKLEGPVDAGVPG